MTGTIRPYGNVHAIKSMAFGFELEEPLRGPAFRALEAVAKQIQAILPRRRQQQSYNFTVAADQLESPSLQAIDKDDAGLLFDIVAPNGQWIKALNIAQQFISVSTSKYEGFDVAWREAKDLLLLVFPLVLKYSRVNVIGLQYNDTFTHEGSAASFDAGELFRNGSELLSRRLLESSGPWSLQQSFFERLPAPDVMHLLSLRVDVRETPPRTTIDIQTTHRVSFEPVGLPELPEDSQALALKDLESKAEAYVTALHEANKSTLRRLLSEEMVTRISL